MRRIYGELHGDMDKRTIKAQKSIAFALLKCNKNEEALAEFLETEVIFNYENSNRVIALTNKFLWNRIT